MQLLRVGYIRPNINIQTISLYILHNIFSLFMCVCLLGEKQLNASLEENKVAYTIFHSSIVFQD